jgi:hypothetical protein
MQHLFAALHNTLGSYLRDALHEGIVDAVACLGLRFPPSFLLLLGWSPLLFLA